MKTHITLKNEIFSVEWTDDLGSIKDRIVASNPTYLAWDTETTGLHLKKDVPQLGAIGWGREIFLFPTNKHNLHWVIEYALNRQLWAHNHVFDLNMMANIVGTEQVKRLTNLADVMGLLRLIFEAKSNREGGDKLKLKIVLKKYIDIEADSWEIQLKSWLKSKKSADSRMLTAMLKKEGFLRKDFDEALKQNNRTPEMLEIYQAWQEAFPEPTYMDVPEEILHPYTAVDVAGLILLMEMGLPVVEHRDQMHVLEDEFKVIPIVFKMSRVGLPVDRSYLINSREKLVAYIERLYARMYELAGKEFKVGQHQVIKELYGEILGELPESVDKKFMSAQKASGDELAGVIMKLRTLEKWLSTYIDRILNESEHDGRFYTALDQFNPVSGRFSGNMQQQPKKALYDDDSGEEIFHPRKAFVVDEGYYNFYLDFSQVELRVQAHYTLPFGGDLNLCRAYMPYKCVHYQTGEIYDNQTEEGKARWNETVAEFDPQIFDSIWKSNPENAGKHWSFEDVAKAGYSAWIIPETGERWQPTDVHSASTSKALTMMGMHPEEMDPKEFKMWRGLGKGVNFAKNYGVSKKGAAAQFGLTIDVANALCDGYDAAFPVVITYQQKVVQQLHSRGYVVNLYGRRYYLEESWRFYKAGNYLVQGTCASDLKGKMVKLDEFFIQHNLQSYMFLCIHDEVCFRIHRAETWIIPHLEEIMEYTPKVNVPIIVEPEWTKTNWADKEPWEEAHEVVTC